MTISNRQFTPEILAHIQTLSDANPGWSRRKLSMQVCEWLQWRSPNGKLKDMSCRVALLELERAGLLHLPPAGPAPPKRTPRPSVPLAGFQQEPAIQCSVSELGDITLVLINGSNTKASRQWNEWMNQHHSLSWQWAVVRRAVALSDSPLPLWLCRWLCLQCAGVALKAA